MLNITNTQIMAAKAAAEEVAAAGPENLQFVTALASAFIAGMRAAQTETDRKEA